MATRKMRKFADGDVVEGQNAGIGDDTRARAAAWLKKQQEEGGDSESEAPVKAAKAPAKTPAKVTDTGDETARLAARSPAPAKKPAARAASAEDIPNSAPAGWKGGKGERVTGSELGRTVANTISAMGPGKLAGVAAIPNEMRATRAAQKAYNDRAALRRSEEGLNAAEAAAAKQSMREKKTLNPLAWMSGPKGMEKFKKGGSVKGWGIARGARKAKIV